MLKSLNIENIAVIEKANIEFSDGLNVLTGETGAGKSIVIDSINAILGERTSKELIRHGSDSAFVSAYFDDINESVKAKLTDFDVETDENSSLLISRKISASGKSVCKINGRTVTATMLKDIGRMLVNIHGQHDSQALLQSDNHFKFIDMLSSDKSVLETYQNSFKQFISVRRKLKNITADEETKDRRLELLEYQIEEIEDADIKIGEKDSLLKRKNIILNNESIVKSLNEALFSFCGNEDFSGISNMLATSESAVSKFADIDSELAAISSELGSIYEKAESLSDLIESKLSTIDYAPDELEQIESRLDVIYKMSSKYGENEEDILKYLEDAKEEKNSILYSDEELEKLTAQYDEYLDIAVNCAEKLHNSRVKTAKMFEKEVKEQLSFLDMANTEFVVQFSKGKLSSTGFDEIEFLISTNAGEPPKPLSKIASGGELSRIMLAIKNIIAKSDTVDTLIFDEIDTGVSGRASRKIGLKLRSVSKSCQVICVTHSAQIASNADKHLLIEKDVSNKRTYTKVTTLDFEQRKRELARIMGGIDITDNLLSSAEELLLSQE